MRALLGITLAILAVAFGVNFLELFTTKFVSGQLFAYVAIATYGVAACASGLGAVRYLRPARVPR